MAGIILATQGIKHVSDLWAIQMQGLKFPWERLNLKVCKCGHPIHLEKCITCDCMKFEPKKEVTLVQGALRPIQLWHYVVPEESIGNALAIMNLTDEHIKANHGLKYLLLRKALGCEEIPLGLNKMPRGVVLNGQTIFPFNSIQDVGMDVRPIGVIYDKKGPIKFPDGSEYDQEQL